MIASTVALFGLVRRRPGLALTAIAGVAALCGLSWCWGYGLGRAGIPAAVQAERRLQADARLAEAQQAHNDYRERVRIGEAAATGLRAELAARDHRISTLQRSVAHVPQLVASAACPAPGDVRLSVGAVRLYDAALTGGADRQLPDGACRAAAAGAGSGAAGAECEQPSGVTVDLFQDVARENARRQGECQVRMRRLVEFLEARQLGAARVSDAACER